MYPYTKFNLLLFICLSFSLNAQNLLLDSCGINDQSILTKSEATFLNEYFKDNRDGFDFTSKKIIFVTGSAGKQIGTKKAYFATLKSYQQNNLKISTHLIPFSEKEKKESNGYDAILSYWTKFFPKPKKIIRKIQRKNRIHKG